MNEDTFDEQVLVALDLLVKQGILKRFKKDGEWVYQNSQSCQLL